MKTVMVELAKGYGDEYAVVEADDAGAPIVTRRVVGPCYTDTRVPIPERDRAIMAAPGVDLLDSHTRVPAGAVRRVIGPLNCPEAVRVRARRYTRNWTNSDFVALATDAELAAAMGHATEPIAYRAMTELRDQYRQAALAAHNS